MLLAVQTCPRGVGKIPRELDEQWTEILVDDVEVIVGAHHAGAVQPREAGAGALAETLGDSERRAALLRHADVEHPPGGVEVLEPALRLIIFALAFPEVHDLHGCALGEGLHRRGEITRDRRHQRARSHLRPARCL